MPGGYSAVVSVATVWNGESLPRSWSILECFCCCCFCCLQISTEKTYSYSRGCGAAVAVSTFQPFQQKKYPGVGVVLLQIPTDNYILGVVVLLMKACSLVHCTLEYE